MDVDHRIPLSVLLDLPSIANVFLFGSVPSVCATETCGFLKLCFIPTNIPTSELQNPGQIK